jgi:hypothetical protein
MFFSPCQCVLLHLEAPGKGLASAKCQEQEGSFLDLVEVSWTLLSPFAFMSFCDKVCVTAKKCKISSDKANV